MLFRRSDEGKIDGNDLYAVCPELTMRFCEPYFVSKKGDDTIEVERIGKSRMTKKAVNYMKTLGYETKD